MAEQNSRVRVIENTAQRLMLEMVYVPSAKFPPVHVHPNQDESFRVLDGALAVRVDGKETLYGRGESFDIPRGARHTMRAAVDEARVIWETRPALRTLEMHRELWRLSAQGKADEHGVPGKRDMVRILREYHDELRLTCPPVWIQRIIFAICAALLIACGGNGGADEPDGSDGKPASKHAPFFLPTDVAENTTHPDVVVDSKGGVHVTYPAFAAGDAFYAYCDRDCTSETSFETVRFKTAATVYTILVALDADKPRVLYVTPNQTYYATCDANCGKEASWRHSLVFEQGTNYDITGSAFALDRDGRPHYIMHSSIQLLGQSDYETFYFSCTGDCARQDGWTYSLAAENEIWNKPHLRFDARNVPHVATVARVPTEDQGYLDVVGYATCDGACTNRWSSIGIDNVEDSLYDDVDPDVAFALTHDGKPRIAILHTQYDGAKSLGYAGCDHACDTGNWTVINVGESDALGSGIDLVLDANDKPHLATTVDNSILVEVCNDADCLAQGASWTAHPVELSQDMVGDDFMPYENCTVGSWFLREPAIALDGQGREHVAYEARDISGGGDPSGPPCTAGVDMTLTRMRAP